MKQRLLLLFGALLTASTLAANIEVDGIYYGIDLAAKTATVTYNMVNAGDYATYSGDVVIPASFTYEGETYRVIAIGPQAFSHSKDMTSVVIPESVTSISANGFQDCSGLTTLTIPNSVTELGMFAFSRCLNLRTITLSNSLKTIPRGTFQACKKLEAINIPNGVTDIAGWAIEVCDNLTSVTIPQSVTYFGVCNFRACPLLEKVQVETTNPIYDSRENCNAVIETATNTLVAGCKGTIIPNSVTAIGEYAFGEGTGWTKLVIPNSVKRIDQYAFEKYKTLEEVVMGDQMETITFYAFYNCGALNMVTLNKNLKEIGEYAFSNCNSLTTVKALMDDPFKLDGTAFGRISGTCILYVPKGTKDKYIDKGWTEKIFMGGIVEMDGDGETDVHAATKVDGENTCFNLSGRRVEKPGKGIFIRNGRKVAVK